MNLIQKHPDVNYEVVELKNRQRCQHPECRNRRLFGVKTTTNEEISVFGIDIAFSSGSDVKYHCPDHRPDHDLSEKALKKEHEVARDKYRTRQAEEQMEEYKKIINSNFIPTFEYKGHSGLRMRDNDRFSSSDVNREESVELLKRFNIGDPMLFVDKYNPTYKIIKNGEVVDSKEVSYDSDISYDRFESKYGDYKFRTRDYFVLQTVDYTSLDYNNKPVSRIENHVGKVIEWREFDDYQGDLVVDYCPICGRDSLYSSNLFYSRVVSDGLEEICVCHDRCESIIGVLNRDLIDKEEYEFGLLGTD